MEAKLRDLLVGAGIGDILMPRNQFVKEHKNLLGVLKRGKRSELDAEYADQAKELKAHGGTRNSGFIQRMMGEVKQFHDGEYKPIRRLAKDSTMNAPRVFSYDKVKTPSEWLQTTFGKKKKAVAPPKAVAPAKAPAKAKAPAVSYPKSVARPKPNYDEPDMATLGQYHHAKKKGLRTPAMKAFETKYKDFLADMDFGI